MKLQFAPLLLTALFQSTEACIHHVQRTLSAEQLQSQVQRRWTTPLLTKTAIENVRVFDGDSFTDPKTVVLEGGFITDSATDVGTTVDGTDKFLIPGLIDAHVHISDLAGLGDLTSYGVTTALNMACSDYDVCNSLRNQPGLASYLSSGIPAVGANTTNGALQPPASQLVYPDSNVSQLITWAFGNGSDWYKIVAKPNSVTQQQQNAMVAAAHELFGKQTTTHATNTAAYGQAVASGTDGIQHVPDDGLLSDRTIAAIRAHGQFVTPTMNIFKIGHSNPLALAFLGRANDTNATYANVERNVGLLHRASVPIVAGTDAVGPVAPGIDVPFGLTVHWELELLNGVGLSTLEALRAGTVNAAKYHRLGDRGAIEAGKRADLVLLNSNPLVNISYTQDIARIWVGGAVVQPAATLGLGA